MGANQLVLATYESFLEASNYARDEARKLKSLHSVRRGRQGNWEVCIRPCLPIDEFRRFALASCAFLKNWTITELRIICLDLGLSPAGWRFIHLHGTAAFKAVLNPSLADIENFANALSYVEWQARGSLCEPLPNLLGEKYLVALCTTPDFEPAVDPRLARVAANHWQQMSSAAAREDFSNNQWVKMLVWVRDHSPKFDRNQWRAGWPALWRQFEHWHLLHSDEAQWDSLLGDFRFRDWYVVPLTTSFELAIEGIKMKHCVADYSARCLEGDYRVFSIRTCEVDHPIATVGLENRDGLWVLEQVKGKCNDNPEPDICDLAKEIERRYRLTDSGPGRSPYRTNSFAT